MISEPSVIPVILSFFWFAVALFGAWCCIYAIGMFLNGIYKLIKG